MPAFRLISSGKEDRGLVLCSTLGRGTLILEVVGTMLVRHNLRVCRGIGTNAVYPDLGSSPGHDRL